MLRWGCASTTLVTLYHSDIPLFVRCAQVVSQKTTPLYHFLTNICALIGGLFTVFSMANGMPAPNTAALPAARIASCSGLPSQCVAGGFCIRHCLADNLADNAFCECLCRCA